MSQRHEAIELKKIRLGTNSRTSMKDHELGQLAHSISNLGQLQPVGVRPDPDKAGHFVLVYGFRRYKAISSLGWPKINCVVSTATDIKRGEDLLQNTAENWVRSTPSFAEQGKLFDKLFSLGLTQRDISQRTGMSERVIGQICATYKRVPKSIRESITVRKSGIAKKGEIPLNVANSMVVLQSRHQLDKPQVDTLHKHVLRNNVSSDDLSTMSAVLDRGGSIKAAIETSQRIRNVIFQLKIDYPKAVRFAKREGFHSPQELACDILKKSSRFPVIKTL